MQDNNFPSNQKIEAMFEYYGITYINIEGNLPNSIWSSPYPQKERIKKLEFLFNLENKIAKLDNN